MEQRYKNLHFNAITFIHSHCLKQQTLSCIAFSPYLTLLLTSASEGPPSAQPPRPVYVCCAVQEIPNSVITRIGLHLHGSEGPVEGPYCFYRNRKNLRVFLKEDLPSRLHYADSYRIPPIIGLLEEGYKVEQKNSNKNECGGAHGYDNAFFSMRTVFMAHGPKFARGRKVPSFENVQIYNLVTSILNIEGAPNNGSDSFPNSVLLPDA